MCRITKLDLGPEITVARKGHAANNIVAGNKFK